MALPLICACAVTAVFFLRDLVESRVVSEVKSKVKYSRSSDRQ